MARRPTTPPARSPIRFAGYSIGSRPGHDGVLHASVRLHDDCLRRVRRRVHAVALHPSVERLAALFHGLRFVPYAPVRRQLLKLLWQVNGRRKVAGLEPVPVTALRLRRWPVRPFGAAPRDAARSVGEALPCTAPEPARRERGEADGRQLCLAIPALVRATSTGESRELKPCREAMGADAR